MISSAILPWEIGRFHQIVRKLISACLRWEIFYLNHWLDFTNSRKFCYAWIGVLLLISWMLLIWLSRGVGLKRDWKVSRVMILTLLIAVNISLLLTLRDC